MSLMIPGPALLSSDTVNVTPPSGTSPVGTTGITATQVAYGSGVNTIKGIGTFTFSEATGVLVLSGTGAMPGIVRLPSGTTSSQGIAFGSDISLHRSSITGLIAINSATDPALGFYNGGTRLAQIQYNSSLGNVFVDNNQNGSLIFRTNTTTAITIDNSQNSTFSGTVITAASTTAKSGFRMPSGTAPTTPTTGDFWYDGTNLKFRDGGTTRTITWV